MVGVVASRPRAEDDGIDEIQMPIVIYQNVSVYGIKDIVLTVGVVSSLILCMKAKTDKFVVNLFLWPVELLQ